MIDIWGQIREILQESLNPGIFKVWISPLQAEVDGTTIRLTASNDFVASWVRERLVNDIAEAATSVMGERPAITVVAGAAKAVARPKVQVLQSAAPKSGLVSEPQTASAPVTISTDAKRVVQQQLPVERTLVSKALDWRFDFDSFVVGPSNDLAFAASQGITRDSLSCSTLFLSSAPGLGKTHLMQAVGGQLCKHSNRVNPKVEYLTAEEFATGLVTSLKHRDTDRFKARYRDVDLLLLEDVHFLQGKERMQDEVLATIKSLQSRGSRVVLSSSFAPRDLKDVDNQLVSRFCSGFLAVIDKPDFETRRDILCKKARLYQVDLPENVTDLLAENIHSDVRQIESCLHNLILKARILNEQISMDMAWDVIGHYASREVVMNMDSIVRCVCSCFDLSFDQLNSRSRKRELVTARNTIFYLARKHTDLSLKQIGLQFNRRHSTVLKGITNLEREMSRSTPTGRQVSNTVKMIEKNGRISAP
ncbi:chromosomal replication initiator protein DnaA [Halodesulfovibrio spirochaetisodalis]|uniref:Chromosomal replication initiator protein DnaA n=1 Tax=Halodesulfovibrio spirochaetisodalis TaxID=1560234 RepID=A0A1B7X907_9BACT|nr:chromosomal replication initiator protein DnaA [Halodesulfovibrio spirochaetisodalis]OBQ45812.1 chromosomal replication initiator protein DnaA [Halodesulfovibrio spirochaetisodalis]